LAPLFDERDPGVKRMIQMVVESAHRKGRKVGICGQAPSDYREFAEFLADAGIDSISLTRCSTSTATSFRPSRRDSQTRSATAPDGAMRRWPKTTRHQEVSPHPEKGGSPSG
jgi:phosphoenolpyruvate-protein kinase (PTS system EI component)